MEGVGAGGRTGVERRLGFGSQAAFARACVLATPERGSQWVEARKTLEDAGFKVFKL